jgi:peptidoglycan L-alanyl-D-glutamate endopeptidase CwlK
MHSRHLPNADGVACAVDVAALVDGHVSWSPPDYLHIWAAVQDAAERLEVPVEWGGNWTTLKDFGHFQLPWSTYP